MKPGTVAQGLGIAMLVLLLRVWPFVSPRHSAIYHNFLPIDSLVWGMAIEVGVLTLFAALLFTLLERNQTGWRTYLWAVVFAELTPVVLRDVAALWRHSLPARLGHWLPFVVLLILILLRALRPGIFAGLVRGGRLLLLLAGCGLSWMLVELMYIGLRSQPPDQPVPMKRAGLPPVAAHEGGKRVIWILFDELSYRQAFEHRYPGLKLPNFDRFKAQSVSFSNVSPAGENTQEVIPSLLLGQRIKIIRSNLEGLPSVQFEGDKQWTKLDAQKTIFADAQRLGWTTGLVGWYNPYCRILKGTLDSCYWRAGDGLWNGTTPEDSAWKNAWNPFADLIREWLGRPVYGGQNKHAADLAALIPQAESVIRDQSLGFVFIHLSVPHPPGIYDRGSGKIRGSGTYLDNMALADRTLGELLQTLHQADMAAKTTIVISSDHSWRLPLWMPTPQWTREESIASEGRFDRRPVLMIHYPGETSEHDVEAPLAGVHLHEILEGILRNQRPGL